MNPEAFRRLPRDPHESDRRLAEFLPRARELVALRRSDPTAFAQRVEEMALARRAGILARSIAQADSGSTPDGEKLKADRAALQEVASRQFDLRIEATRHELEQVRVRADRMSKDLEVRTRNRDDAIAKQVRTLLEQTAHAPREPRRGPRDDGQGAGMEEPREPRR